MDQGRKTSAAQLASAKRYKDKMRVVSITVTPDKAQDIKDCAALAGLSITQYLLMCHEYYQNRQ